MFVFLVLIVHLLSFSSWMEWHQKLLSHFFKGGNMIRSRSFDIEINQFLSDKFKKNHKFVFLCMIFKISCSRKLRIVRTTSLAIWMPFYRTFLLNSTCETSPTEFGLNGISFRPYGFRVLANLPWVLYILSSLRRLKYLSYFLVSDSIRYLIPVGRFTPDAAELLEDLETLMIK